MSADPKVKLAQKHINAGYTYKETADNVSGELNLKVTQRQIERWVSKGHITRQLFETRKYDGCFRLKGDWVVSSDYHVRFVDLELVALMVQVAKKFGVKNLLIAGDLMDQTTLSSFFVQHYASFDDELEATEEILTVLSEWFTDIHLIVGNHDLRLLKRLEFKLGTKKFFKILGNKLKASAYPYCWINDKWRITHPKNYSKIATKVAHQINHREQCHVGVAHGHAMGVTYSPSGKEILFDTGGMFDQSKVEYKNLIDTTHGNWISGFSLIYNNHLYQFPKNFTDWNLWLNLKIPKKR